MRFLPYGEIILVFDPLKPQALGFRVIVQGRIGAAVATFIGIEGTKDSFLVSILGSIGMALRCAGGRNKNSSTGSSLEKRNKGQQKKYQRELHARQAM